MVATMCTSLEIDRNIRQNRVSLISWNKKAGSNGQKRVQGKNKALIDVMTVT